MNVEKRKQEFLENYCKKNCERYKICERNRTSECRQYRLHLESLIDQLEADKAELLEALKSIPCTCDKMYKDRGLSAPDCPQCNYVDLDLIEKMEK